MEPIILKIPYADKDAAKETASKTGGRLIWLVEQKNWAYEGDPRKFPQELKQYRIKPETAQARTPTPPQERIFGMPFGTPAPVQRTNDAPSAKEPGRQSQDESYGYAITTPVKNVLKRGVKQVLDLDWAYYQIAKTLGVKFDKDRNVYYYDSGELPVQLTGFDPKPFSREERIQRQMNNQELPRKNSTGKYELRPHQTKAKQEILKAHQAGYPGFLLADDLGLGKTITTWSTIQPMADQLRKKLKRPCKILIVCPINVIPGWRETILELGHESDEIIITNYQRLKKFHEMPDGKKAKSLKGTARFAEAEAFDIVVLDEAHRCRNLTAATTKLAMNITSQASFIFWLSATAGQRVLELGYLAPLMAARTGQKVTLINKDFEIWCKSQNLGVSREKYGKWTQTPSAETEERVHNLLFKPDQKNIIAAIRRLPSDIAGWPERQIILKKYDADEKELIAYKKEWDGFLAWVKRGKSIHMVNDEEKKGMGQLVRLRQKASLLKTPDNAKLIKELVENGRQVAVSCFFHESINQITEILAKDKIECAILTGKQHGDEKERQRLSYQKEKVPIIIFSPEEGINLHAGEYGNTPRAQINHDIRWSAISMRQIDGRSHRNGQFSPIYWTVLAGTVEERVAEILIQKTKGMDKLNGDDNSLKNLSDLLSQAGIS